jgi:tRNA-binding EMAP/Myf-like protein
MSHKTAPKPTDMLTATGVIVGKVVGIRPHVNAECIRIADVVYLPGGEQSQIIFGERMSVVKIGSLVPVAPPTKSCRIQGIKMRRRRFRGVASYGELCSLYELGLATIDTDQVAVLLSQGDAKVGMPLVGLIKDLKSYDQLWTVFQRPIGFKEDELLDAKE